MTDLEADIGMTVHQLAESAHRAYCHAMAQAVTPWEEEGPSWFNVAAHFMKGLDGLLEGKPVKDAAEELFGAFTDSYPVVLRSLPPRARIAWEAVVRHLWQLCEQGGADPELLEGIEKSWREWADSQMAKRPILLNNLAKG